MAKLVLLAVAAAEDLAQWSSAGWCLAELFCLCLRPRYVQNDGVMGGRSNGDLEISQSGARFQGSINLDGSWQRYRGFISCFKGVIYKAYVCHRDPF